MKSRILGSLGLRVFGTLAFSGLIGLIGLIGCDTKVKRAEEGIDTPPRGSPVDSPFLFNIEAGQENLCAGSEIILVGVNFSSVLEQNIALFRFQNARVPGLPVRVE